MQRRLATGFPVGWFEVRLIDIAEGDHLAILVDQEGVQELIAAVADADEAKPDAVVAATGLG